ncbi:hypothetical protein [Magnetospirillum sp. UT-4]|uniref:hypothetical protein n=1 Tax=Magnetospirillum sp. UT-4 TaxID=2681467 RepID=UPI0013818608|nr:hypothetical protein [Magnetospirillum sp. UT-4]CAA7622639.1 hypothetical protein MTBUT4_430022 [Magnetospirillum sp. UT-4]
MTRDWKAGDLVGPDTKPGTPIATGWDKNGNSPSKPSGNHAGIFVEWDKGTGQIKILDQNSGPVSSRPGRGEKPAEVRPVSPGNYRIIQRR